MFIEILIFHQWDMKNLSSQKVLLGSKVASKHYIQIDYQYGKSNKEAGALSHFFFK